MSDAATTQFGLGAIGRIAMRVADIDGAVAFFRDPNRNPLALMSEARP
jgi:hypothetical protein